MCDSKATLPSPQAPALHKLLSGHPELTRGMPTGKAFTSLSHQARVTRAGQLCVHSSVWEAAIEEVWPWPGAEEQSRAGCPTLYGMLGASISPHQPGMHHCTVFQGDILPPQPQHAVTPTLVQASMCSSK